MDLLTRQDAAPAVDGAQHLLADLTEQVQAASLWADCWRLYLQLVPLFEELTNRGDGALKDWEMPDLWAANPAVICEVYLWPVETRADFDQFQTLERCTRRGGPSWRHTNATSRVDGIAVQAAAAQFALRAVAPAAVAGPTTAAEQLASIRSHDLIDFWITFGITVVAFLLVTYPDKSFGLWWQYLAAAIAGATGQVAIAWKLLPWYRSYTVAPKTS